MKINKKENKITLSKNEWERIGKEAKWMKTALGDEFNTHSDDVPPNDEKQFELTPQFLEFIRKSMLSLVGKVVKDHSSSNFFSDEAKGFSEGFYFTEVNNLHLELSDRNYGENPSTKYRLSFTYDHFKSQDKSQFEGVENFGKSTLSIGGRYPFKFGYSDLSEMLSGCIDFNSISDLAKALETSPIIVVGYDQLHETANWEAPPIEYHQKDMGMVPGVGYAI